MDIHKINIPLAIILAAIIIGGFLYASQVSKQNSIERQQQRELNEKAKAEQSKKDEEALIRLDKMNCVDEAQQHAVDLNIDSCKRGEYCVKGDGAYLVGQYDTSYNTCLQRKGLK